MLEGTASLEGELSKCSVEEERIAYPQAFANQSVGMAVEQSEYVSSLVAQGNLTVLKCYCSVMAADLDCILGMDVELDTQVMVSEEG